MLTEWRVPRSWPRALIYAVVVVGCAIASRDTAWLTEPVPLSADNHARMSLNLAFACVYCGVMAARSPFKPSVNPVGHTPVQ